MWWKSRPKQPARGYALCIGLNSVDPRSYGGWSGNLLGCENDARDFAAMFNARGYEVDTLLTRAAPWPSVRANIRMLAKLAKPGDVVVITNSSHGGQVKDYSGDESDGYDETICMFDRQVTDDELAVEWSGFASGVRVVFISDSCHSGTVARVLGGDMNGKRAVPRDIAEAYDADNAQLYRAIAEQLPKPDVRCSLLHLGACQDNQLASDGAHNGLFTGTFLTALKDYPTCTLGQIKSAAARIMGAAQSPTYKFLGPRDKDFERRVAFAL